MMIAAVLARAGSQGLPGKNLLEFDGMTLIEHAYSKALDADVFPLTVVNTDIPPEHLRTTSWTNAMWVARRQGQAGPLVSKWEVWQDTVRVVEERTGTKVESLCDIDVTRPLTTVADVVSTVRAWFEGPTPGCLAVSDAKKSPYFDLYEHDSYGHLVPSKRVPGLPVPDTRQQAPTVLQYGGIFVIERDALLFNDSMWSVPITPHRIEQRHCFDIDTALDWQIVNAIA